MAPFACLLPMLLLAACATYCGTAVVVEPPLLQPDLVLLTDVAFEPQGGSADCGPTALRMALRRLDCELSPDQEPPVVDGGTTMAALRDTARAHGPRLHAVDEAGFLAEWTPAGCPLLLLAPSP